jgi:heptosyltransferase-2
MQQYRNILVRAPNWIGDAVMAIPALSALRAQFPKARITLLAKPPVAALFAHHPDVDRVIVYERPGIHAGVGGLWRLIQSLRKAHFDLALLLQNAFEAALIASAAGIPTRMGYATDGRRFLLTDPLPKQDLHRRLQYLALLDRLGGVQKDGLPYLVVSDAERQEARRLLESEGVTTGDRLVGIHPGAAYGPAKRWSPARFAALADALAEALQVKPVLFGSAGEIPIVEEIRRAMKSSAVSLAGKSTVRQMMAAFTHCQLLVTNDSGPMHVAAALGVPVVALFGPTNPMATSPAGSGTTRIVYRKVDCAPCTHRVCPIDHRCMEGISVEAVLEAVAQQMAAVVR